MGQTETLQKEWADATAAAASRLERRFALCGLSAEVAESMALLNLRHPIPVAESEEEAIAG